MAMPPSWCTRPFKRRGTPLWWVVSVALSVPLRASALQAQGGAQTNLPSATSVDASAAGQPFTAAQLQALLPATVYFRGQSASLQMRNAGGTRFGAAGIVLAALVDTSGYSSGVQEAYQFYFITETAVVFGGQRLSPGAYGAGFLANDRFGVMDIGAHLVAQGATAVDRAYARPRPLQILPEPGRADAVRLYLGRRWVLIEASAAS